MAHSAECNVIVVDSDKQLQKILKVRDRLPQLRAIVQYNEPLQQRYDNVYTVCSSSSCSSSSSSSSSSSTVNSAFQPSRDRSIEYWSVWLGLRNGTFTCVVWQITLCDLLWQVTLRSFEMGYY